VAPETKRVGTQTRLLGVVLVIAAAVLWSGGGIGVKSIDLPPLAIAGYRALFAIPVMALDAVLRARRNRAVLAPLVRRWRVWGAAVSYALMVVTFVISAKMGSPSNAILIQYSGPIYVAIFAWPILRERLRVADGFAIIGCLLGLAIFFAGKLAPGELAGNAFAVLSSFGFAGLPLFMLAEERAVRERPAEDASISLAETTVAPIVAMTLGNAIAALICAPVVVTHRPSVGDLLVLFLLGTFQIGVPYILYGIAVRHLRAVESSLLATVEPLLTPLWLFLFQGEIPGRSALLGGGVIVGAVALQSLASALGRPASGEGGDVTSAVGGSPNVSDAGTDQP
jgi:DME family drug/metabolite transporter